MDVLTGRTSTMAGSSGLNPNAPSFVPLAYRTVEEFTDQRWQLLDSSPWFRDYWLHRSHRHHQRQQLENENTKMTLMMKKENDHHEEEVNYDDRVRLPDADVLFHGYQPPEEGEKEYWYTRDVEACKAAKWNPVPEIPIRQRYMWGL